MKLLVLTEYSKEIGFGHINRTLCLVERFARKGWDIMYYIREATEIDFHMPFRYLLFDWATPEIYKTGLELRDFDAALFDTYRVDRKVLSSLSSHVKYPVSIVDSMLNYPDKGLLIFGSVYAKHYQFNSDLEVLAGVKFMLFREDFVDLKIKNKINNCIKNIVISLGKFANSVALLTAVNVVRSLLPDCTISVIGFIEEDEKKKIVQYPFLNTSDYVRLLQSADLVVCNGGQTLNECVALNIPNVSVQMAVNQQMNIDEWEQLGVTISAGEFDSHNFGQLLSDKIEMLRSRNCRAFQHEKSENLIDLKGPDRIIKYILNGIESN